MEDTVLEISQYDAAIFHSLNMKIEREISCHSLLLHLSKVKGSTSNVGAGHISRELYKKQGES
jgi:hypothetical protein